MKKNQRTSLAEGSELSDLLKIYSKHWKWFLISGIFFLTLASIYLRYSTPEYKAASKIQILEEKSGSSELSVFADLDFLGKGQNNVEDEIEILKSRSNLVEVIDNLNLNISLIELGNIKNSEIYSDKPFKINFLANDSIVNNSELDFFIEISDETTFRFSLERDSPNKIYSFGKNIKTKIGDIVITPDVSNLKRYINSQIKVSIRPLYNSAEKYQEKIIVAPATEFSNILNISLEDPIREKAIDILNNL